MAALIFGSKVALASLPNINVNAVLIILTAVFFGWRSLYTVYVYVLLEGLVFGFSIWWIGYLYIWAILAAVGRTKRVQQEMKTILDSWMGRE